MLYSVVREGAGDHAQAIMCGCSPYHAVDFESILVRDVPRTLSVSLKVEGQVPLDWVTR